jgi:hypothetical protein
MVRTDLRELFLVEKRAGNHDGFAVVSTPFPKDWDTSAHYLNGDATTMVSRGRLVYPPFQFPTPGPEALAALLSVGAFAAEPDDERRIAVPLRQVANHLRGQMNRDRNLWSLLTHESQAEQLASVVGALSVYASPHVRTGIVIGLPQPFDTGAILEHEDGSGRAAVVAAHRGGFPSCFVLEWGGVPRPSTH